MWEQIGRLLDTVAFKRIGKLLEALAFLATIIAALVAVVAFKETLGHERDIKAVELLIKFNELEEQLATKPLPRKSKARFWRENTLLLITETVFRLTGEDPAWEETVQWMLKNQKSFLLETDFTCKSYARTFLARMKEVEPQVKCN